MNDNFKELSFSSDFVFGVCGINDKNNPIGSWVISGPYRAYTLLASEIPCW